MSSIFDYTKPATTVIVKTGMMNLAIRRTLAVHHLGGLSVWSGRAGVGKTTTAQEMVKLIESEYNPNNPKAFRAVHYELGKSPRHEPKHGIRSLYYGVGYKLDEGRYRNCLAEELAADLVHYLKKMNIQIIIPDEAGCLSLEALRGIALVSDTAHLKEFTLSIIFIGMDNLPNKLERNPQIARRVHEWCYFKPCTLEETHKLLAALHPYFAGLNLTDKEGLEQIRYIQDRCKGMPGSIVPFASRFGSVFREFPNEDPLVNIQAAFIQPLFDKERSIKDSQHNYSDVMKRIDEESDTDEVADVEK